MIVFKAEARRAMRRNRRSPTFGRPKWRPATTKDHGLARLQPGALGMERGALLLEPAGCNPRSGLRPVITARHGRRTPTPGSCASSYLKDGLQSQNLHNRTGSSGRPRNSKNSDEARQKNLIDQLLGQQPDDGGWRPVLTRDVGPSGPTQRRNRLRRLRNRLVLHVLQTAGAQKAMRRLSKAWLGSKAISLANGSVARRLASTRNVTPRVTRASSCPTRRPPLQCSPSATEPCALRLRAFALQSFWRPFRVDGIVGRLTQGVAR